MLRYADDTVLIPENKEDLQQLLTIFEEESRKKGLQLNSKKIELMVISQSYSLRTSTSLSKVINSSKGVNSNTWVLQYQVMDVTYTELPENEIYTNK